MARHLLIILNQFFAYSADIDSRLKSLVSAYEATSNENVLEELAAEFRRLKTASALSDQKLVELTNDLNGMRHNQARSATYSPAHDRQVNNNPLKWKNPPRRMNNLKNGPPD